ncbi:MULTISPECIES: hypothetical protein [unclassified Paenibacillus]|uniref:hypothetical protein n=1 Tax=unclassified Paenibacillus TaxID=185978 RepID=UPI001C1155DA|nr:MULTISPECIES: hypothetical protein [unclassified Paenibacillus]MBU5445560.1 hypothetical protein [Paenibacillus sp. MSJ-34]CAH0120244.1 hypothetical protein PAE9249_02760 [Paenibacillus sp. CECT 9249]
MNLLLPIATAVLVLLGSFCLFIAMENDRRARERWNTVPVAGPEEPANRSHWDKIRGLFMNPRNS